MSEEKKLASVDGICGNGWSAKAAAGDALQRVNHTDAIVCIWVGKDGKCSFSKANTSGASLATFASLLQAMAAACWEEVLR